MFTPDNLKMFGRYGLTIAITYAVASGLLTPASAEILTKLIIEVGGLVLAAVPAFYAANKIDNAPKT